MLGNPKFKPQDRVSFQQEINGVIKKIDGVIYVADPEGTAEQKEEPSYDIEAFVEGEVVLFKHIRESLVSER
ncbi:MAG: hypothetical protein Q4B85_06805 [Lachnospiraceae bacterium]|nr:hypothetical protein [Lachnospiraceae bacterium]